MFSPWRNAVSIHPRAANLNDRKNRMGTVSGPRAENRDRPEFVTEGRRETVEQGRSGQNRRAN